jgi:hypothetical protein
MKGGFHPHGAGDPWTRVRPKSRSFLMFSFLPTYRSVYVPHMEKEIYIAEKTT